MKKLILIATVAALSACSQKAEETPVATDTTMAEATPAADTGVTPGTYDVTNAEGQKGTTTINADGTYEDTGFDGKITKGTYARKDGKDCFDEEGDAAEVCWTVSSPDANGSFTATSEDGKIVLTVAPANTSAAATGEATATATPTT